MQRRVFAYDGTCQYAIAARALQGACGLDSDFAIEIHGITIRLCSSHLRAAQCAAADLDSIFNVHGLTAHFDGRPA